MSSLAGKNIQIIVNLDFQGIFWTQKKERKLKGNHIFQKKTLYKLFQRFVVWVTCSLEHIPSNCWFVDVSFFLFRFGMSFQVV